MRHGSLIAEKLTKGMNKVAYFPTTVEEQINFEALDNICTCITWRFDQPGYRMYCYIQELLKAARKEEYQTEFTFVTDFYGSNLNPYINSPHK